MTLRLAYLAVALAAVVFVAPLVACRFTSHGRVPGPFAARLSRLWYLAHVLRGDFETTNQALHRRYGPILRLAPGQYSIDDPSAIKTVYGHGTKFTKGPWYDASGNPHSLLKDLFTERDPQRHAAFRRRVAHLYSMTSILKMEPSVNESIRLMIARLADAARTGATIDMQHLMQCYAFDVIGELTLGKRFGFLDKGEDALGMFPSLHAYLKYCAAVGVFSEWHSTIFGILSKTPAGGMGHMVQFTQSQINERMTTWQTDKMSHNNDDFLSQVLRLNEEQPDSFTFEHVFITCMTNIGAGSDTTSISLASVMYHLLKYPNTLRKLREELDERLVDAWESPVSFQDAQKMPYLQACIKEALRMHPATGLPLSRTVPPGGATVAGTYLPQGSIVGINTWVAHRNEQVFGADAALFRPERWMITDKEQLSRMESYYIPFGHGSRTCIGKNISLMEITKLVPRLVSLFDFNLVNPDADMERVNVWFVKPTNLQCHVSLRLDKV